MSLGASWAVLQSRAMPPLWLLLLTVLPGRETSVCHLRDSAEAPELAQDGDLVIGGIFSFRTGQDYVTDTFQHIPDVRKCKKYAYFNFFIQMVCVYFVISDINVSFLFETRSFNYREFKFAQTLIFAVEEINRNPDLLPNLKIGYKIYNNCGTMDILRAALALVSGLENEIRNENCTNTETIQAILGHSGSRPTIAFSQVVGRFHIPVVS